MLKIGIHEAFLKPINPVRVKFDKSGKVDKYVNLKGEELQKVSIAKAEFKWVNKVTGAEHDKTEAPSKSFNGQPVGTQDRSDQVEPIDCDKDLIFNYAKVTKTYQIICATLKEELKGDPDVAKTFQYSAGRNYFPERAIVYYDLIKDIIVMKTLAGDFSKIEFKETQDEKPVEVKDKAKPLTLEV